MFITKIEIENFLCFNDRIVIDLTPNKNGIEEDIKNGVFYTRNNKVMSPLFSIAGANASGKTSIIKAIAFLAGFFNSLSKVKFVPLFMESFSKLDTIELV